MTYTGKSFKVPQHVIKHDGEGESVLLNLETEGFHGLNPSAARFWCALTTTTDFEAAHEELSDYFAISPELLRKDLIALVDALAAKGLLDVVARSD